MINQHEKPHDEVQYLSEIRQGTKMRSRDEDCTLAASNPMMRYSTCLKYGRVPRCDLITGNVTYSHMRAPR